MAWYNPLGILISWTKEASGQYDTVWIEASGVSPNAVAAEHSKKTGRKWEVGDFWNEDDYGVVVLHSKRGRGG